MTIQNLLRPHQVDDIKNERIVLGKNLASPHITDKASVSRQLRQIDHQLQTQTPKPFEAKELDDAVKREAKLREEMLQGMPSQEEMRKSPPGAVDKHRMWEKRNKTKLMEWKNIMLRLNHDSEERDVANFEKHRPASSTLNMDNAIIQGKSFYFPPGDIQAKNVMSDEDKEQLGLKDKRGSRKWTPEQREAASQRMKQRHDNKEETI